VAVAVVGGAALGVGEDLVGLRRLLELLLGVGVVAVDVGVQLARQAPEGLLDLGLASLAADAEDLIRISGSGPGHSVSPLVASVGVRCREGAHCS
jgi:hypothetical protein